MVSNAATLRKVRVNTILDFFIGSTGDSLAYLICITVIHTKFFNRMILNKYFVILINRNETNPNLQFNSFVVPEDCLDFEVYADCADERRRERIVGIPEEEGCFADTAVADDQDLEHEVKVLICGILLNMAVTL